jgi:c-di-GMP-related signal transduction protein
MKYLTRQPILDRKREVFAYELLFRDGIQNRRQAPNPVAAVDWASALHVEIREPMPR